IKQAIDFIRKYDLDGADIDFEYPANKKQWDGYSKVLVEFKKELLKLNLPLSIALPSWGVELSAEAIKAVDEVQMMQYDLFDEKRRHAPFEVFAYGIEYFQKIGFTKEKLYPGLALYGREKDVNAEERWLSYEGICMMYDLIDANTNEMDNSYFTGKTMNRDKTFYALLKGCGGIMLFQYACDLPFENELSIFRGVSEIINGFVKIEAPKAKVEKPKAKVVETPKAKVEEPKAKVVETPKAKVETPKAKVVETPKVKIEEPKAEQLKFNIEEPKAKVVETPKVKVEEPKAKVVEAPKVKIEELKAKVIETPKVKIEEPKAKVVETPKVKVEAPKLKAKVEAPKLKEVAQKPKIVAAAEKPKIVAAKENVKLPKTTK
ncbi:MAG: glycosyl hydrolase family 18 protein, partial [Clostridia bacterium]